MPLDSPFFLDHMASEVFQQLVSTGQIPSNFSTGCAAEDYYNLPRPGKFTFSFECWGSGRGL